jgi:hypothetical protein
MVYLLAIAACLFFYPKQSLQWLLATIIAGCAAGYVSFTYYHHEITWFILYFVVVYAPIMGLFELLNRKPKASVHVANDNGRAKA